MTRSSKTFSILLLSATALTAVGLAGCKKDVPAGEAPAASSDAAAIPAGDTTAQTPAALAPLPSHLPEGPVDSAALPAVVARINGLEVKRDELIREAVAYSQIQHPGTPLTGQILNQALNSIIARTLLEQEAHASNMTVSDAAVEAQFAAIRSRFPSAEAFQKALTAQGTTEAGLKDQMRRDGAVQKLLATRVVADVSVSDQAAHDFYDKNQDKMQKPERVHVRHILVRAAASAPQAEKDKARVKAEALLKRIKNGESFAKIASESSEDPGSKARGGDLAWLVRGQTVPSFDKAAFALAQPNDLSPVVETEFGFHIIQLVEREQASVAPFEEAQPKIADFLKRQMSRERVEAHVRELRAKGKVETFL
jgi:peptidyl-prolyl cis-trans isomerase C